MAQQAHTRPRIDGDERNGGATCQVPLTGQADRTREYSAPERHGEAPVIVPSEMKGRKHPMTDDEFLWLLERERRELVTAGRPTIDRGWKTRRVTGAMVSVAAPDRARTTKGQKQDG